MILSVPEVSLRQCSWLIFFSGFADDTEEALKAVGSTDYYDETLDDEDEEWAIKQRQGRRSDGILSCPACFTTLCMDCQRYVRSHLSTGSGC